MLTKFLNRFREHEWYPLLDFLSPVFFEIVPAWDMVRILTQLTRESTHTSKQQDFTRVMNASFATSGLPLQLGKRPAEFEQAREWSQGDLVLRLYFLQILQAPRTCLDLRYRSFHQGVSGNIWEPKYFVWQWSQVFLNSIRAVYVGFYEDREDIFREGLTALRLDHAEHLFRQHFGGDNQRAMRFALKDFRQTFHDIFISCRDQRVRLPPEFLPFGLYLITLYEHLEHLDQAFDVRAAYEWAATSLKKNVSYP